MEFYSKQTGESNNFLALALSSRKNLCIHPEVRSHQGKNKPGLPDGEQNDAITLCVFPRLALCASVRRSMGSATVWLLHTFAHRDTVTPINPCAASTRWKGLRTQRVLFAVCGTAPLVSFNWIFPVWSVHAGVWCSRPTGASSSWNLQPGRLEGLWQEERLVSLLSGSLRCKFHLRQRPQLLWNMS